MFRNIGRMLFEQKFPVYQERGFPGWNKLGRAQTIQQKEMLPGGPKLLSEYFQSCDRKGRYDKAIDELLFRFSGQAGDEYHCNQPNIMVIRQISW